MGARLQYSGLQARGYVPSAGSDYAVGAMQDGGYYKQRFNYMNLHADMMFNMNALFGGYNPSRVYEVIPYVGAGFIIPLPIVKLYQSMRVLSTVFGYAMR